MQSQSAGFPLRKMENPAILGSDTEGKQGTYNGKKNRRRGALPPSGQQPACKGNHYFLSSKFFKKFTRRKFPHHSLKLPFATFAHRVRFPFGIQRDANIRIFSETTHNNRYFLTNLLKYNQIISYFNSFYDYYYSFQSFFSFKISFIQPDKIDRTCAQCLFRQIIFTSTVQIDKPRESEGFRACS